MKRLWNIIKNWWNACTETVTPQETVDVPMTTNEECAVFGMVDDILQITEPNTIWVVRDKDVHIEALRGSWAECGGNLRGAFRYGVFYICTDNASPSLKQSGNTYIKLLFDCGMGSYFDEKTVRRELHQRMKEQFIR